MSNISHTQKMANRLEAKVMAQNQLGLLVNEWTPKIRAVLANWVGKKVSLATGGKPIKLKAELDALGMPSEWRKQIIISFGSFTAKAEFRVSVGVLDDGNRSAEMAVYLGNMDGLILKDLSHEFTPTRTDYNVAEVKAARQKFQEAEKAFSNARSALHPFGEHDNH